jgi:hypothetical protein
MKILRTIYLVAAILLIISVPACSPGPTPIVAVSGASAEKEFEEFDPRNFSNPTNIDNQWMPMKPGSRTVYEGTIVDEDNEKLPFRLEFIVTDLTKDISGVDTVVAWIVDYKDGELVEKEIAFYAQDDDGTVWYLGEHPEEYEDGNFIDAPTWIHGYQDARAGIKMHADPMTGSPSFSQGYGPSVDFMDRGMVSQTGIENCVPLGCYKDVVVIDEFTLVEPNAFQLKYYAPGIGNIRVGWRGEDAQQEDLELIEYVQISQEELAKVREEVLALEKHAYEISKDVYANTRPME